MKRGKRDSEWLVIRRCLAMMHRLQRGPASREALLEAVIAQEGPDAYGDAQGPALQRRFENDLARIRERLGVEVHFDRTLQAYIIADLWVPLLDLPDEDLATIAWLETTFGPDSPQHDEVHALLQRLRFYLSPKRKGVLERCRIALAVDLRQRDEDEIAADVWKALNKAVATRRRVTFEYRSPRQDDGVPRRHVVDPYDLTFDTARGHYYLRGWCHSVDGPRGTYTMQRYFDYRVGRIQHVEMLPTRLPPTRPTPPRYAVVYELAPQVARLGISHHPHIEILHVERHTDGSAVVHAQTESLFGAVQALLHYGAACRVIGGPEMLHRMRRAVQDMARLYPEEVY